MYELSESPSTDKSLYDPCTLLLSCEVGTTSKLVKTVNYVHHFLRLLQGHVRVRFGRRSFLNFLLASVLSDYFKEVFPDYSNAYPSLNSHNRIKSCLLLLN
jgi:hypothetical protein